MRSLKIYFFFFCLSFSVYGQSSYSYYSSSEKETVFYDSFLNNNKYWSTSSSERSSGNIISGKYYWKSNTSSVATTDKTISISTAKDFEIEGKFLVLESKKKTVLHSLVWGGLGNKRYYFGYTQNGDFRISYYDGTSYTALKDWTNSTSIYSSSYNKLTVRKVRSKMYFFINEKLVHTMPFKTFFGNKIGFQAASSSELKIDYLRVSYVKKSYNNTTITSNGDAFFKEDFYSNSRNWSSRNDSYVSNGYYYLKGTSESTHTSRKYIDIDTSKDFEIKGRFMRLSGGKTSNLQSLIWGAGSTKKNYFGFTADGSYRISYYDGSKYYAHKDWTKNSAVSKYGYNEMKIRKVKSRMYFYINGTFVHSMPFKSFYGNYFGFQASTATKLKIDYLYVSYLAKSKTDYSAFATKDKEYIFEDQFSNNNNSWSTGTSGKTYGRVSNGTYLWKSYQEKSSWTSHKNIYIDQKRDFEIEARMKYVSGKKTSGIMLKWGSDSSENYNIEFNGNGKYWIGSYVDGEYIASKSWTASSYINKETYNKLTVRKIGKKYYFFINEKYLHAMDYRAFFGDKVGFTTPPQSSIEIDYLKINYLDKNNKKKKEDVIVYNNPPEIKITEPGVIADRGFKIVKVKSIKVAGFANDKDGIAKVTVNNQRATLYTDGSFDRYVDLINGDNKITITATDTKGKSSTKSITLNYNTPKIVKNVVTEKKQRRLALVIGNSNYAYASKLRNPVNDANAMKTKLEGLGFTVLKFVNGDQNTIKRAIDEFGKQLKNYDIGLFFYAGHGVQVNGSNYLVPTDAKIESEDEVEYDCVKADRVLSKMKSAGTKTNLVVLDACRNNPFERSWSRSASGNGLAFMNAPRGSLIAYATAPGNTASDGLGKNGTYTGALLKEMDKENITILEMFQNVRAQVIKVSKGKQTPWESTSLTGNFFFKKTQ
ncbi:caspase family protein [Polaribacter septentrionalilitoris]|uniref:caspase family protein n=1 Tax=Polaribacter septentrionalilitoris TaxID=2494657 RepID=UPI00135A661F|nr:caspase family protein [Polaribacter septentrionalilitoris]